MDYDLYSEDEIIELDVHLKNLVGKELMDDSDEFYVLKSFNIVGIDHTIYHLFRRNEDVRMFYIQQLVIEGSEETYTHEDDEMCSADGVLTLMNHLERYSRLRMKLIKFGIRTGISLDFTSMKVLN